MSISSLLSRLLLWHKFVVLSVVALLLASIPTYFYVHETNKIIDAAILEGQGMQPVASILKVVQLTQQHRGLSALVLGGVESAKDKLEAKQSEANQAYDLMAADIKAIHDPAIDAAWKTARTDWDTLRAAVANRSLTVPQSYAAHTALIPKLLVVSDLVGDYYGLSLDPDVDTYQLIQSMYYQLPYLTEELGKMRAKGAGLLAKKEATPEDRMAMLGIIARVNDRLGQVRTSFGKAVAVNPLMKEKLASSLQDANDQAAEVVKLASDKIVNADALDYSSVDYVAATTRAIDAQVHVTELANQTLQSIQTDKIDAFHRTRWTMVAAMLALIGIATFVQYLIARSVSAPLADAIAIAQRVASGDLTSHFDSSATNETGRLLQALKQMNDGLIKIVSEVRLSVDNIGGACGDIASGNADLSARTESQAASLEETASSMEEITSTVKQNADNAGQANRLVVNASEVAVKGGTVVREVVQTMEEINDSSRKIVDIIAVIDGIAFQTNILALNAAVEAARAGEQGRGFAVVAAEVRNLAQRSASAAKEIKELIGASVEKVAVGNKLVGQAGHSMDEIVASIKRVTDIMSDIAMASKEQTGGIEQVNLAITQMDEVTQQNAALVEQAAAAAESLNDQAKGLMDTVSVFHLGEAATPTRTRSPTPAGSVGRKPAPAVALTRPAKLQKRNSTVAAAGTHDDWEEF